MVYSVGVCPRPSSLSLYPTASPLLAGIKAHFEEESTMKTTFKLLAISATLALATQAIAAPTCAMQVTGNQVKVIIADTGLVYRLDRQQIPPQGAKVYTGTGRPDVDRTVSCKDANGICAGASWYLRFADAQQGFPGDEALASDPRVVPCTYDAGALAQVCTFTLNDGMKTDRGEVRMHFSAKVGDQVPAAYQPQRGGCAVTKDADGNPHTTVAVTR